VGRPMAKQVSIVLATEEAAYHKDYKIEELKLKNKI
jgi:hypothetical protein